MNVEEVMAKMLEEQRKIRKEFQKKVEGVLKENEDLQEWLRKSRQQDEDNANETPDS